MSSLFNDRRPRLARIPVAMFSATLAALCSGVATVVVFGAENTAPANQTLVVTLADKGASNQLFVDARNIAAADSIERVFDLKNGGKQVLDAIPRVTVEAASSSLLDEDRRRGLQMTIEKCSVVWTPVGDPARGAHKCSGVTSVVVGARPVIGANVPLDKVADLADAGSVDHLRLRLTLPARADNSFQGLASTFVYSFSGTQRHVPGR